MHKKKGKGSMLSITIEQKPIDKKTMDMIKQAEKAGNVVKMKTEVHEKDEPKPEIIFSTSLSN